jgi:hypothetical protein
VVDTTQEHAALRLQAHLAGAHGLRLVLAPTTDFRVYYDALPADPLAPADDPAVPLAREALERVARAPWGPHVEDALRATAQVVRAVAALTPPEEEGLPLLFTRYRPDPVP